MGWDEVVGVMLSVEPILCELRTVAGFEMVPPLVPAIVIRGLLLYMCCEGAVLAAELCMPIAPPVPAVLPIAIGGGAAGPPTLAAVPTAELPAPTAWPSLPVTAVAAGGWAGAGAGACVCIC